MPTKLPCTLKKNVAEKYWQSYALLALILSLLKEIPNKPESASYELPVIKSQNSLCLLHSYSFGPYKVQKDLECLHTLGSS